MLLLSQGLYVVHSAIVVAHKVHSWVILVIFFLLTIYSTMKIAGRDKASNWYQRGFPTFYDQSMWCLQQKNITLKS